MWGYRALVVYIIATSGGRQSSDLCLGPKRTNQRPRTGFDNRHDNLLVAGRCVAGDKVSHAATRQMMCCSVTGQGAGVAAAMSVKDEVSCAEVDLSRVQQALEKQGVRIK